MKKVFVLFLTLFLSVSTYNGIVLAQDTSTTNNTTVTAEPTTVTETPETPTPTEEVVQMSFHQDIKTKFIDGGWQFMAVTLLCLIFGLAIAIERIITLSLATVNTKKLVAELQGYIEKGDIQGAQNVCKATPGPTAEVLGQGLKHYDEGIDAVEKAIVSNGSLQTGYLEKGLVWMALFIALGPMLGFLGTVWGMIGAFDSIQKAGDIQPSMVAGGIKVALLTTVLGLIVAMILQIFYNFITSKVDSLVSGMEDATISLVDIIIDVKKAEAKNAVAGK